MDHVTCDTRTHVLLLAHARSTVVASIVLTFTAGRAHQDAPGLRMDGHLRRARYNLNHEMLRVLIHRI